VGADRLPAVGVDHDADLGSRRHAGQAGVFVAALVALAVGSLLAALAPRSGDVAG
jgi:hypothetical protein